MALVEIDGCFAPAAYAGATWTHPRTLAKYDAVRMNGGVQGHLHPAIYGWLLRYEAQTSPVERDVPHWAVSNVAAFRVAHDLPSIVTDRMIFAAMLEAGQDKDADATRLKEWADSKRVVVDGKPVPHDLTIGDQWTHPVTHVRYMLWPEGWKPVAQKPAINGITRDDVERFQHHYIGTMGNALNEYQTIATKSAIYPGQGTPLGLAYVALKLNGEAGEFAEHVGKAMRDDGYGQIKPDHDEEYLCTILTPERRTAIIKEIGDQLWYLSAACNELGIKLSDAATTNLEKLCDRTERDALRGSGDNR